MEKLIEFSNASHLWQVSPVYSQIDDNYLFCHIKPGSDMFSTLVEPVPFKISGTMLMLVRSGSDISLEINLEEYTVGPGTLLMIFPGNVIRTSRPVPTDLDVYVLYYDIKFSRSVNINLTAVAIPSAIQKPNPLMKLSADEVELLGKYFMLVHLSTLENENEQIKKSIATSLTAAIFYQLVQFYHKRLPMTITGQTESRAGTRRNEYVREFLRLVHIHYIRERSVAFYADKLFISPKYLSLLVKESTGRSASNWIDEFVLMEAKNMLRFSGKNIQQVAYALNFPTQSSFGKYFKHLTGMSPTEYQKS